MFRRNRRSSLALALCSGCIELVEGRATNVEEHPANDRQKQCGNDPKAVVTCTQARPRSTPMTGLGIDRLNGPVK